MLKKQRDRGFRGHPLATVAFYGPTDRVATKVAVGILPDDSGEVGELRRWTVARGDVRMDTTTELEIVQFLRQHGVRSVVMSPGILGCPHEEGVDYPDGESCPQCPFWKDRDRWAGLHGDA